MQLAPAKIAVNISAFLQTLGIGRPIFRILFQFHFIQLKMVPRRIGLRSCPRQGHVLAIGLWDRKNRLRVLRILQPNRKLKLDLREELILKDYLFYYYN